MEPHDGRAHGKLAFPELTGAKIDAVPWWPTLNHQKVNCTAFPQLGNYPRERYIHISLELNVQLNQQLEETRRPED